MYINTRIRHIRATAGCCRCIAGRAEAMTIAEPPEPLIFQHSDSIINKQNLQEISGPAARHSCPVVSISGFISITWFRLDRSGIIRGSYSPAMAAPSAWICFK